MTAKALFGGKPSKKKTASRSKKGEHPRVELPKELRKDADIMIAGIRIQKDLKKKVDVVEKRVKSHMLRWWCEQYALTGKRPPLTVFDGNVGNIQFIQTRRMNVTASKTEALEALGIDLSDHLETSGVKVNVEALKKHGLMEKLMAFMDEHCNEDQMSEIFEPVVTPDENILENLPTIVGEMDGELADNLESVMQVLDPVKQVKKPDIPKTDAECFELVSTTKISSS